MAAVTGFGVHAGHQVHLHDHSAQLLEQIPWCQGRFLCQSCSSDDLPKGAWFQGPECPRPKPVPSANGRKP